ncbi:MAG: AAA family ATPase [Pseudomonadota bacterium]|nr:AAA family ATPase [Pseudomonadota bacterium]
MFRSPLPLKDGLGLDRAERVNASVPAAHNISRLISASRRQARVIIACCLAGGAVGTLFIKTATPLYTASAAIIIDNRPVRALRDISSLPDSLVLDNDPLESQVEVLRSEQLGLAVVKQLKLSEDPAFVTPTVLDSVMATLEAIIGPADTLNGADPDLRLQLTALKALNVNLRIIHIPHTLVLKVDYTSPNPVRAAEITNAYANAYMLDQVNSHIKATRSARSWLQQRTAELRQLSVDADLAAQKFMADNNLLATKGTRISEQQFNEMRTQLVLEAAATAQARARYLRIKNIIDSHQTDSAVTEALGNPVINELRTKYLDASKRRSDLERKLGPAHVAVVDLTNTMQELSTLLFQELGRIAETYRNDYEVAAAREKALTENLTRQQGVAVSANDAQAHLRQLEQKAESYKTVYQSFMQRYTEAEQQETFAMTDAHVLSVATPPLAPSYPRKPLVLVISLALGAFAGVGAGMLRESMDRVFRTVGQVREELGVDLLGMLPVLSHASVPQHVLGVPIPIMYYAIDHPYSAFAETLRSAKVAADLALKDRSPKIIGVVSLLPNEGKSTVAKNFASLLALQGAKTLLIDADMRNPSLTRAIGCERRQGSQSESCAPPPLAELLRSEPESGLQILPCIYAEDDPRVADGLSSATLHSLLQSSNQSFDYIVIDLPPIGPVVNARGMASAIDTFILVVAWGTTSRGAVSEILAKERVIRDKLLGVVLNKVDMEKLKLYEHFDSDGYYHRHYENYYKRAGRA